MKNCCECQRNCWLILCFLWMVIGSFRLAILLASSFINFLKWSMFQENHFPLRLFITNHGLIFIQVSLISGWDNIMFGEIILIYCHLMFTEVVTDRKTSLPCENHTSRILGRMVVLHTRTERQGTKWSSTKESHWGDVENQIEIELMTKFWLILFLIIISYHC